eukprot:CAMPEP_0196146974 /NCGR_PEP_ID=MMETSP0910-20130528/24282_1 /TAXON_ID=49265 /ORGANISM="Thalassiosira rotula, Strain GSO102" /LENGTH=310 /DNA_ID=CAMNT_0041409279 /DNA_START=84 /DNA_END=1016 /DNA_ORIENTATION=-
MTESSTRCPTPIILSIANALAYTLNSLETFGCGPFSHAFSSNQDNASISQKYQTIITPHGIAFSIWALIFLGEAACVVAVIFSERCRTHPLMVEGVTYWFVAVCLAQTAWSPAFAYESMLLSAVFMTCILLALIMIVTRQYNVVTKVLEMESTTNTLIPSSYYWLLQFPFELHLGWIIAAFALNVNILVIAWEGNATIQKIVAVASLIGLAAVSYACLWVFERPQYTVSFVAAWATFWMSFELRNPKQLITDTFSDQTIHSFFMFTISLSGIIASVTVIRWIYYNYDVSKRKTYSSVDNRANGGSYVQSV